MRGLLFVVALLVYLAWLGWLGWMNATAGHPTIINAGQIATAPLVVEGEVKPSPNGGFIARVLAVVRGQNLVRLGDELTIEKLDQAEGWTGPGSYVLALQPISREGNLVRYQPAPVPHSPLFGLQRADKPSQIYPATPSVRAQLARIFQAS